MNPTKSLTETLVSIAIVMVTFFLIGYNAYYHNFQLLFLTIVTFINSVGIGTLLNKLTKND